MYSVLYPESKLTNFPDRIRKRSVYHLEIYWAVVMKIRFPVSASAKIDMVRSVVLDSNFKNTARHLEECVGFLHISSVIRSYDFLKMYVSFP